MAVCSRCGRVNAPDALFCQDCGEPLEALEEAPKEGRLVCPACGNANPPETRFCRMCGVRLTEWGMDSKIEKRARISCPVCGKSTPKGFAFCQFCGSRIFSGEEKKPVEPTPPAGLPRPVTSKVDPVFPADEPLGPKDQGAPANDAEPGDGVTAAQTQEEGLPQGDAKSSRRKRKSGSTDRWPSTASGEVVPETPLPSDETRQLTSAEAEALQELSTAEPQKVLPPDKTALFGGTAGASSSHKEPRTRAVLVQMGPQEKEWPVAASPFDIGRREGRVKVPEDPYLSSRHARVLTDKEGYVLKDLESVNGVYLRVRDEVELSDGAMFCAGKRVMLFERLTPRDCRLEPMAEDGVALFGTPLEGVWGRLRVLTVAGVCRGVYYLTSKRVVLGRTGSHVSFPNDPGLAPSHLSLERTEEGASLTSLGPDRDTFVKIREPHRLKSGDVFRIGQQLFRFEMGLVGSS